MKPGRNAPCPCGSGKKYKKCCLLKEQNGNVQEDESLRDIMKDDEGEEGMAERLLNAMHRLRRYSLDKKPHIKAYNGIRKMHGEIIDAMVKYYDDGKFELSLDTESVPQEKGGSTIKLINSEFDLDTRAGGQSFFDMIIYKSAPNANCITEAFIRSHRYRKPEKVELLQSMLDSHLGLFEVTGTDMVEGYAYLKDVFTGAEHKITDIGLSGSTGYGDIYLYTRIIDCHGISFGTGLNLAFEKTDGFIQAFISREKKDWDPRCEFVRFTQLYNHCALLPDKVNTVD